MYSFFFTINTSKFTKKQKLDENKEVLKAIDLIAKEYQSRLFLMIRIDILKDLFKDNK